MCCSGFLFLVYTYPYFPLGWGLGFGFWEFVGRMAVFVGRHYIPLKGFIVLCSQGSGCLGSQPVIFRDEYIYIYIFPPRA